MSCRVEIDTPGPFYSGTQVQGRLICSFHSNEKVRGIKIRAYGDEHTEWWGTESYYNHAQNRHETRSVLCTGDNNLFGLEQMVYGGSSGETRVGPGTFTYPFSFQLPYNLPSTFENSHGYIRYTLKGVVDIPWGMDYEDKVHFVVLTLIDLNSFPQESFRPVSNSDTKTICCWCCAGGDVSVDINMAKSAFVPGESLKMYIAITNMSNSNVDDVEVKLTQYIKSRVERPQNESKTDENVISENTWSGVGAHGENKYDVELPIPTDIIVPNLDRSSLFEVYYEVQVTAGISGCHTDIDLSFLVNLGHLQHQSQLNGPPPPGGSAPPPQIYQPQAPPQPGGDAYPYPNAGGGYPSTNAATYPNAPGAPYPTSPPNAYPGASPYPQSNFGFTAPGGPAAPTPYSSDAPAYSSVTSDKPVYPGGPPTAPGNPKAAEAFGGGAPSAPFSEPPPPSYDTATRKF